MPLEPPPQNLARIPIACFPRQLEHSAHATEASPRARGERWSIGRPIEARLQLREYTVGGAGGGALGRNANVRSCLVEVGRGSPEKAWREVCTCAHLLPRVTRHDQRDRRDTRKVSAVACFISNKWATNLAVR